MTLAVVGCSAGEVAASPTAAPIVVATPTPGPAAIDVAREQIRELLGGYRDEGLISFGLTAQGWEWVACPWVDSGDLDQMRKVTITFPQDWSEATVTNGDACVNQAALTASGHAAAALYEKMTGFQRLAPKDRDLDLLEGIVDPLPAVASAWDRLFRGRGADLQLRGFDPTEGEVVGWTSAKAHGHRWLLALIHLNLEDTGELWQVSTNTATQQTPPEYGSAYTGDQSLAMVAVRFVPELGEWRMLDGAAQSAFNCDVAASCASALNEYNASFGDSGLGRRGALIDFSEATDWKVLEKR